jgi:hypothetical protein
LRVRAAVHDQTLINCIDSYLHFRKRNYDDQPADTPSSAGEPPRFPFAFRLGLGSVWVCAVKV